MHAILGIFIPLIVVNCLILARAESFASKNSVGASIVDAVGMGIGFTIALTLLGIIREFLGMGTFFGMTVFTNFTPMTIFVLPPGAFLTLALILVVFNVMKSKKKEEV